MTIAKISPYEAHLIAAADEVIGLRIKVARMSRHFIPIVATTFALGLLAGWAL